MKTGRRRSEDYDRAAFAKAILEQSRAVGISRTALAKHSLVHGRDNKLAPINKGTISGILFDDRHATPEEREAIMRTLKFSPDLAAKFVGEDPHTRHAAELITDYNYPRPPLVEAVQLLVRGFYSDAYRELRRKFGDAVKGDDLILQADAAARMAWLFLEIGDFVKAEPWAQRSIVTSAKVIGLPVAGIIQSAAPVNARSSSSKTAIASRILSDAMHLRSQIFVSKMLYLEEWEPERAARSSLEQSLALDRRLDLPEPVGNDLGWKAVMEITAKQPELKSALRLLDECAGKFARGGLYEAHLLKTNGIIYLRSRRPVHGRNLLIDAKERLSSFADSRGLALNLYLLGDFFSLHSNDRKQPLRHFLAAGALHPYGFLLDRCRTEARSARRAELQREIDDLLSGKGNYAPVHQMMKALAQHSPHTPEDLLYRNINLMAAREFPAVAIPARNGSAADFQKRV